MKKNTVFVILVLLLFSASCSSNKLSKNMVNKDEFYSYPVFLGKKMPKVEAILDDFFPETSGFKKKSDFDKTTKETLVTYTNGKIVVSFTAKKRVVSKIGYYFVLDSFNQLSNSLALLLARARVEYGKKYQLEPENFVESPNYLIYLGLKNGKKYSATWNFSDKPYKYYIIFSETNDILLIGHTFEQKKISKIKTRKIKLHSIGISIDTVFNKMPVTFEKDNEDKKFGNRILSYTNKRNQAYILYIGKPKNIKQICFLTGGSTNKEVELLIDFLKVTVPEIDNLPDWLMETLPKTAKGPITTKIGKKTITLELINKTSITLISVYNSKDKNLMRDEISIAE